MNDQFKVKLTNKSLSDINDIAAYIQGKLMNSFAAHNVSNKIFDVIDSLSFMPERNRAVMHVGEKDIRKALADDYSIFYYVDNDELIVHVIAVIYSRRDCRAIIEDRIQ